MNLDNANSDIQVSTPKFTVSFLDVKGRIVHNRRGSGSDITAVKGRFKKGLSAMNIQAEKGGGDTVPKKLLGDLTSVKFHWDPKDVGPDNTPVTYFAIRGLDLLPGCYPYCLGFFVTATKSKRKFYQGGAQTALHGELHYPGNSAAGEGFGMYALNEGRNYPRGPLGDPQDPTPNQYRKQLNTFLDFLEKFKVKVQDAKKKGETLPVLESDTQIPVQGPIPAVGSPKSEGPKRQRVNSPIHTDPVSNAKHQSPGHVLQSPGGSRTDLSSPQPPPVDHTKAKRPKSNIHDLLNVNSDSKSEKPK
ncbi:hypothetical protein BDP27DRAFT_392628 [Rhodocollybia butyracea]|uniref:Uncharacterized protein n=1 Tax=Rhodocollybia butyracea TaxID=206335 RepID=A0A9P5PCG5_9AGAR|nr:hypothetical protein BDP27DRAFT_392628 [Rhodocollybia butyracea]